MAKIIANDETGPVLKLGMRERISGHAKVDVTDPTSAEEGAGQYPWTYADPLKRPIGSLFVDTDNITDSDLKDYHERCPMAQRAVDLPVDETWNARIKILIDGKEDDRMNVLWQKYSAEWKQHFRLTRLYGHNDMLYGWLDDPDRWSDRAPTEGLQYSWLYASPKEYEVQLEETESIPNKIKSLSVNYGNTTLNMLPGRFTHSMIPKLCKTDKQGESVLVIAANGLHVQIHADWSIGQALFRRAAGLLAMFAPKRNVSDKEKSSALGSVANHNSKTVLYIPFGWNIKDVLKPGGNMAIARTYNLITQQLAAAVGIPEKILLGEVSATDADPKDRQMYYNTVHTFREGIIKPALEDWVRKTQVAGMAEPGKITIKFGNLDIKNDFELEQEKTTLGAMKLLQARMNLAADATGVITDPLKPGCPETTDLVKIISPKK